MARRSAGKSGKRVAREEPHDVQEEALLRLSEEVAEMIARDKTKEKACKDESSEAAAAATTVDVATTDGNEEWFAGRPSADEGNATWSFRAFCPLCFSTEMVNPVAIHTTNNASQCAACKVCVQQWNSLFPAEDDADFEGRTVQCPLCSELHELGCATITLSDNALLHARNRIPGHDDDDSYSSATSGVCGVCEEPATSLRLCLQCQFPICDACEAATHSKGRFKSHELVPIAQARRHARKMCPDHAGQPLDLYCHDCASALCVSCCFSPNSTGHGGHDVQPIKDAAESASKTLHAAAVTLAETAQEAQEAHRALERTLPPCAEAIARVESEVRGCFAQLRAVLQKREEDLLAQLASASTELSAVVQERLARSATASKLLQAVKAQCETATAEVDHVTLMALAGVMQQRFASLQETGQGVVEQTRQAQSELEERLVTGAVPVASFYLLTAKEANAEAVAEYTRILSTLGTLEICTSMEAMKKTHTALEKQVEQVGMVRADGDKQESEGEEELARCSIEGIRPPTPQGYQIAPAEQQLYEARVSELQLFKASSSSSSCGGAAVVVDSSSHAPALPPSQLLPQFVSQDTCFTTDTIVRSAAAAQPPLQLQVDTRFRRTEAHTLAIHRTSDSSTAMANQNHSMSWLTPPGGSGGLQIGKMVALGPVSRFIDTNGGSSSGGLALPRSPVKGIGHQKGGADSIYGSRGASPMGELRIGLDLPVPKRPRLDEVSGEAKENTGSSTHLQLHL